MESPGRDDPSRSDFRRILSFEFQIKAETMRTDSVVFFLFLFSAARGYVYERCELARELHYVHGFVRATLGNCECGDIALFGSLGSLGADESLICHS